MEIELSSATLKNTRLLFIYNFLFIYNPTYDVRELPLVQCNHSDIRCHTFAMQESQN